MNTIAALFPATSTAVQVTVVVPTGNVVLDAGTQLEAPTPLVESTTVGGSLRLPPPPDCCANKLGSCEIAGGVLSTFTVTDTDRESYAVRCRARQRHALGILNHVARLTPGSRGNSGFGIFDIPRNCNTADYQPPLPALPVRTGTIAGGVTSLATVVVASASVLNGSRFPTRSRAMLKKRTHGLLDR